MDKLVTQGLLPWAFTVFFDLVRVVEWCKFHLHIMFGWTSGKNFNESRVNVCVV